MAVNELSFNQLSTVLAEITSQATGSAVVAPVDTQSFVSVANTALLTGYDNIMNAVSQVLSRTVFSVRPYNRKFKGLEVSPVVYGNHIRKLNAIDLPFEDDDRMSLVDGESVDQYIVRKPKALQTNYYGENVLQKHITIFKDQLDAAFSSADDFGRFISMIMSNQSDQIEQSRENVARATIANLAGGVSKCNASCVFHLVTLYNSANGTSLTTTTVMHDENFPSFVRWLSGFLANLVDYLSERTTLYHLNITNNPIMRHTPKSDLKIYMNSAFVNRMLASAYSVTFHENYLKTTDFEKVTFWQNIGSPYRINVDCGYINASGAVQHGEADLQNVIGILFDREAASICTVNEWASTSPFNSRGGYINHWYHWTTRFLTDFTENALVLCLD